MITQVFWARELPELPFKDMEIVKSSRISRIYAGEYD